MTDEQEIVKSVISRLDGEPRRFRMYAAQTLYYSVEIDAYSEEEAYKKFNDMEVDYNNIYEEGETIHTKTTEVILVDKTDANGVVSSGWTDEVTLWERK
jgi:hypothetical protein